MKFLFIIFLCFSLKLFAQTPQLGFEDWAQPELVTAARGLSMGNAYISKVDDAYSAFYNPAGLGSIRDPSLHLFNLHFETNKNMLDLAFGGNLADNADQILNYFSPDGMRTLLNKPENRGQLLHNRFNAFPNFTTRYFTLGYFMSKQLRAYVPFDSSFPLELADRFDHGPVLSTNISMWGGVFKVGSSIAYVNRSEHLGTHDITMPIDLNDTNTKKGGATIITAGAKLTLPIYALPTFSAVLRNAANQKFSSARGAGAPDQIRQSTDLGFSLTPQIGKFTRVHFEFNWRDVGNKYNKIFERRAMGGMEIDFARKFYIRAGYGDGYGSGGIGFRASHFTFDFLTYATEATPSDFRVIEDRRFAFSISSGI